MYRHIGGLSEINWFENSLEYQKLIFENKINKIWLYKGTLPFYLCITCMLNIVHKTRVHVWRPASQDFNIFIIIHMFEAHRRNERCSWYKFIFGLVFFSSWETRGGSITGIMILLYYTSSKSTELFFALSTKNNGSI